MAAAAGSGARDLFASCLLRTTLRALLGKANGWREWACIGQSVASWCAGQGGGRLACMTILLVGSHQLENPGHNFCLFPCVPPHAQAGGHQLDGSFCSKRCNGHRALLRVGPPCGTWLSLALRSGGGSAQDKLF